MRVTSHFRAKFKDFCMAASFHFDLISLSRNHHLFCRHLYPEITARVLPFYNFRFEGRGWVSTLSVACLPCGYTALSTNTSLSVNSPLHKALSTL